MSHVKHNAPARVHTHTHTHADNGRGPPNSPTFIWPRPYIQCTRAARRTRVIRLFLAYVSSSPVSSCVGACGQLFCSVRSVVGPGNIMCVCVWVSLKFQCSLCARLGARRRPALYTLLHTRVWCLCTLHDVCHDPKQNNHACMRGNVRSATCAYMFIFALLDFINSAIIFVDVRSAAQRDFLVFLFCDSYPCV